MQQGAALRQQIHDGLARCLDVLTGKYFRRRQVHTITANRVVERQVVRETGHKIVLPMARSNMHCAGTGLHGNEICVDHRNASIIKRVLQLEAVQQRPPELRNSLRTACAIAHERFLGKTFGQHQ